MEGGAMRFDPNQEPTTKRLNEWMIQGKAERLFDDQLAWTSGKEEAIKEWLDRGRKRGVLLLASELDKLERDLLHKRFKYVAAYLVGLILLAISVISMASARLLPLLVCVVAGILGSAAAALISSLNRRANGFEDRLGNASPDPFEKKERFSDGMSYWFFCRPFLGAAMAAIAYWGMAGAVFLSGNDAGSHRQGAGRLSALRAEHSHSGARALR